MTLWQYYGDTVKSVKGMSLIYNLLQDKLTFHKTKSMTKWETDLNSSFSNDQWKKLLDTHTLTHTV